jgi:hypothetical protein
LPEALGRVAVSVLLLVSALTGILILVNNFPGAEAQRLPTVTVTVYVPTVQTVLMPVYRTLIQTVQVSVTTSATVTSVTTTSSSITFSQSVTQWNTVTSVTTAMGVFGAIPGMVFGSYSDLGLIIVGTGLGVAVGGSALAIIFQHKMQNLTEEAEKAARIEEEQEEIEEKVKRYDD